MAQPIPISSAIINKLCLALAGVVGTIGIQVSDRFLHIKLAIKLTSCSLIEQHEHKHTISSPRTLFWPLKITPPQITTFSLWYQDMPCWSADLLVCMSINVDSTHHIDIKLNGKSRQQSIYPYSKKMDGQKLRAFTSCSVYVIYFILFSPDKCL